MVPLREKVMRGITELATVCDQIGLPSAQEPVAMQLTS